MDATAESFASLDSNSPQNYMGVLGNTFKQKPQHRRKNQTGVKPPGMYKYRNEFVVLHPDPHLCVGMDHPTIVATLTKLTFISHDNLLSFVGVVLDGPERCVLTGEATRCSLYEFMESGEVDLTLDLKTSLLLDVASGMHYVHHSALEYHGQLTSKCCFLDAKLTCKIGRYWSNTLSVSSLYSTHYFMETEDTLWMAPEVLRDNCVSNKSDIYSFGIIMQEVLLCSKPYAANELQLETSDITKLVSAHGTPFRPSIPGFQAEWNSLAGNCWHENPNVRPNFVSVRRSLIKLNGGKDTNAIESMLPRMEIHTKHLEELVQQKSAELVAERCVAENLICELLPRSVFDKMKAGKQIEPESFDMVTIFSSDIKGFTQIATTATPMGIVMLLNQLYILFDDIIVKYDVYKVATIGDAYIVVSGLPERNGDRHAGEIASMSLEIMNSMKDFEIPHLPGSFLKMRIGLHTGPCVAAITGLKMPRYLLFGETVNTGARVEAAGEPMRVHMSDTTTLLLEGDCRFVVEPREEKVDIPGHGLVQTSWLIKKIGHAAIDSTSISG